VANLGNEESEADTGMFPHIYFHLAMPPTSKTKSVFPFIIIIIILYYVKRQAQLVTSVKCVYLPVRHIQRKTKKDHATMQSELERGCRCNHKRLRRKDVRESIGSITTDVLRSVVLRCYAALCVVFAANTVRRDVSRTLTYAYNTQDNARQRAASRGAAQHRDAITQRTAPS